jgi:hypothetical protein
VGLVGSFSVIVLVFCVVLYFCVLLSGLWNQQGAGCDMGKSNFKVLTFWENCKIDLVLCSTEQMHLAKLNF